MPLMKNGSRIFPSFGNRRETADAPVGWFDGEDREP
jgi:hypothetical protein